MARIGDVVPTVGDRAVVINNDQGVPHNFHIHNAAFAVTAVAGRPPSPESTGRKDTVYVARRPERLEGGGADDVRPRRVRIRRAAGRCQRFPAQERATGRPAACRPRGAGRVDPARPSRHLARRQATRSLGGGRPRPRHADPLRTRDRRPGRRGLTSEELGARRVVSE
ncbi:hypothetical protein E1182_09180 [Micromonospora sp. KC721]|nr:hypothetical protein E1182_09180 [Micromonospora sp. KC721]